MLSWAALAGFTLILLGGGYMFREQIITAWPQSAKLYGAIGVATQASALRLADVTFSQAIHDGRPGLTVRGMIINDGATEMTVPMVLVKLRNAAGRDIFQWTYRLPNPRLGAGAKLAFETSQADPPPEARNLEVTFASGE